MKWYPEHIILSGILAGCFTLVVFGFNGEVKSIIALGTGALIRSFVTLGNKNNGGT